MSHNKTCLNCNTPVADLYCPHCGQKTDTHRITFKHFVFHDILHGVWHFEKGILFSLREGITRPGKAGMDYISGKRIRYYNVFYLILLLIGLNLFVMGYYEKLAHIYLGTKEAVMTGVVKSVGDILTEYSKLLIFSFVPLFAVNSFLIFRKKRLNLSEHFIIAGMVFLGVMIIATITNFFFFLDFIEHMDFLSDFVNAFTPISIVLFILVSYYKTFRDTYSRLRTLLKSLLFIFLLILELIVIMVLALGYFTNWTYNMKGTYS